MSRNFTFFLVQILSQIASTSGQKSCGERPMVGPLDESRIVGGQESPEGAWPWMVSIWVMTDLLCGGAILSDSWVISAAHCYWRYRYLNKRNFLVMAGLHSKSAPGSYTQIRTISEFILHEDFDFVTADNDMMLLLLGSPLNFTDYVQPICVPYNVIDESMLNLTHCYITGWGTTQFNGTATNILQEAEVELIDRSVCRLPTWFGNIITENMLCAGLESGAADACQGDSGGPLQCYSDTEETFYVVGITSFGAKCGLRRKPGVYSRITRFSDWLKAKLSMQRTVSAANKVNTGLISILFFAAIALKTTVSQE